MSSSVLLLTLFILPAAAYPQGAPTTGKEGEQVCIDMFPVGHGVDAQPSPPPYEIILDKNELQQGSINVTVRLKPGEQTYTYFEGVFVQARMASCGYSDTMKSFGNFSLLPGENFLQLYRCGDTHLYNAVGHKMKEHKTEVSFLWDEPHSEPGHIFFRATLVKNTTTFWTEVFSEYVRDPTDTRDFPKSHCEVRTTLDNGASSFSAVTSLILAAFVIVKLF